MPLTLNCGKGDVETLTHLNPLAPVNSRLRPIASLVTYLVVHHVLMISIKNIFCDK